ncbi:MAG: hypothetical protein ACKOZU_02950, partial [Planctomycetaceae bacterium]
ENKVPVTVCRMVPEEQVRQVSYQVCKFVTEEKVEPVQVQVMKYVTEERSVQVPRVVEKREPYTYTVRMPRTVVTKVPLDACGNPLPAAAPPAAATTPATPAAGPVRTFSDKPADAAPATSAGGWGASNLDHVDPSKGSTGTVRAERPVVQEEPLTRIEPIPAPAAKETPDAEPQPTVAPPGPTVYPPPPAGSDRDVPAAETSGAPGIRRRRPLDDHTT